MDMEILGQDSKAKKPSVDRSRLSTLLQAFTVFCGLQFVVQRGVNITARISRPFPHL